VGRATVVEGPADPLSNPHDARRMAPMARALALLTALLLTVSLAWAAGNEVQGKVKSWDAASNMLTLEDGTQISIPANAKVSRDQLKPGANVKASFEEKDGKKLATSVEVTPGQ